MDQRAGCHAASLGRNFRTEGPRNRLPHRRVSWRVARRAGSRTHGEARALSPGVLFSLDSSEDVHEAACVTLVELLDHDGSPLAEATTLASALFRISSTAKESFRSFSAVLQLLTPDGLPLILTSTTPDHQQEYSIAPGNYSADCESESLPLAAGDYVLGVGLAIPGVEYVWREEGDCRLHVAPRDVFGSGLPPSSNRYLVAAPHRWTVPRDYSHR